MILEGTSERTKVRERKTIALNYRYTFEISKAELHET